MHEPEAGLSARADSANGRERELLVAVAVLTYRRPALLERALRSFAALETPPNSRLLLLVIENDEDLSAAGVVDARKADMEAVHYIVEKRRGIPVARNRAITEAIAFEADLLCFFDDDEFLDEDWARAIVECWRRTDAHLIGGPVAVTDPPGDVGLWQRAINASLAARMVRKSRRTAQAARRGGRFTIVTNNWLCDLNWLRRARLRFDETLLVSGGSDTAFFHAAKALGAKPAWCPEAIVYETMTADRLSLRYQFRRGAAQSINHFRMKSPTPTAATVTSTIAIAGVRFVLGALLFVIPVFGRASPIMAVRSLGWSVGRVRGVLGGRSTLYE